MTGLGDLDDALEASVRGGSRAIVELSSPLLNHNSPEARVAAFAVKHRLPTISMFRSFAMAGGLLAYGPTRPEYDRPLARYIDKILKGARPGDLPIEQPSKFELIINLAVAKALGLTLSQSLLVRADQLSSDAAGPTSGRS